LLESFRNLLVVLYAGEGAASLELPEAQLQFYQTHAPETEAGRVLRIIDSLIETDSRMRYALSRKTILETGLIRCSRAAGTVTINELLKQVAELKKNFKHGEPAADALAEAPSRSYSEEQKKKQAASGEIELLLNNWHAIINQVCKADPLSRRYFIDTAPLQIDGSDLVVGYDPEFKEDLERFDDARAKLALARAVEHYLGHLPSISFNPLKPDDRRPLPSDHLVENASDDDPGQMTGLAKWYANPVVKTVVEAFNGEIEDVRE
jgi:hypothetical protein